MADACPKCLATMRIEDPCCQKCTPGMDGLYMVVMTKPLRYDPALADFIFRRSEITRPKGWTTSDDDKLSGWLSDV